MLAQRRGGGGGTNLPCPALNSSHPPTVVRYQEIMYRKYDVTATDRHVDASCRSEDDDDDEERETLFTRVLAPRRKAETYSRGHERPTRWKIKAAHGRSLKFTGLITRAFISRTHIPFRYLHITILRKHILFRYANIYIYRKKYIHIYEAIL